MRPYQVLLFIVCVMAYLAALCLVLPGRIALGDKELRWPTITEVFGQNADLISLADTITEPIDTIIPVDTVILADTIIPEKPKPVIPKVSVDSVTDSRMFLRSFYDALAQSGQQTVRVLHYGDSQNGEIKKHECGKYAAAGLALIFLFHTFTHYPPKKVGKLAAFCVLFFVVIPLFIYTLAYIPAVEAYAQMGYTASWDKWRY